MSAAISCLYEGFGYKSPITRDISLLKSALVKSGTKLPAKRTPVMPCVHFYRLFQSWRDEQLTVKQLRLRAITLLALCFMTRPSDLAPKGVYVDSASNEVVPLTLSMNQVVFQADKSITITCFGTDRSGFEVTIPSTSDPGSDPVRALKAYLHATVRERSQCRDDPVFVTLKKPYRAIRSETVASILSEAINLAGLGGQGYTPRSFRATGATAAVAANTNPQTAM